MLGLFVVICFIHKFHPLANWEAFRYRDRRPARDGLANASIDRPECQLPFTSACVKACIHAHSHRHNPDTLVLLTLPHTHMRLVLRAAGEKDFLCSTFLYAGAARLITLHLDLCEFLLRA